MRILSTQYSVDTSSFDIYLAGCNAAPKCEGCCNPESWAFNQGKKYDKNYFASIKNKVETFDTLIDKIMILGGEPLDQDLGELSMFIQDLCSLNKEIWLFTHYSYSQVPLYFIDGVDYLKTGRHIPKYRTENNIQYGVKLSSSNQNIFKLF